MHWLNYHHLLYFSVVAREGSISRAGEKLRLSLPTISGQIKALERRLGESLLVRRGRGLELTEVGRLVHRYADEIFGLGQEMMETLQGTSAQRAPRLVVGVANALPKLIARRLLAPAWRGDDRPRLVCLEGDHDRLVSALATHTLDVVLSDAPVGPGVRVKAFNHELGACGTTFFAAGALASRLRRGFPSSLRTAAFLLPTEHSAVRRELDQWFEREGINPRVAGEFEDSALLKVFAQAGGLVFAGPTVIAADIVRQHGVKRIADVDAVQHRFFAISVERRLKHPAVAAIAAAARDRLFS